MVRILISRSAERELARLPQDVQERFAKTFEQLEQNPGPGLAST